MQWLWLRLLSVTRRVALDDDGHMQHY
jgi:hypothetical protein